MLQSFMENAVYCYQCLVLKKKNKKIHKKNNNKKRNEKNKSNDVRILGILKIARRMEKNGREENYKNF